MFDGDFKMVLCNQRYLDMFGLSPRFLIDFPYGGACGVLAVKRAARAVQNGDAEIVARSISTPLVARIKNLALTLVAIAVIIAVSVPGRIGIHSSARLAALSNADIERYMAGNPLKFANRQVLRIDQLVEMHVGPIEVYQAIARERLLNAIGVAAA